MVGFGSLGERMKAEAERACVSALRWTLAGFGALAILFSGTFPPFANPNELSRFQTVVAAVDFGTFAIDPVLSLGSREDQSVSGGRTYSNKAPGLAFAAIPVYRLLRLVLAPPQAGTSEPIFWLLRFLTVSLVCLLALARFGRRLMKDVGPRAAPLIVAAVAFGTPFLFYARSFFAHAWTAALLFLSWDLLRTSESSRPDRSAAALLMAAGFLGGWAAISEYTVAPLVLLIAIRATANRAWRPTVLFCLGAAIPVALLLAYNAICFGSPWVLSTAREAYPAYSRLSSTGLFGFGPPSASVAAAYLVHPARGVLVFSPFLLWAIPGFVGWWRSRANRADWFLALAATVLFFVLMTGYPNWHGGWSLGNRYLLPIIFFPALALGYALETPLSRGLFAAAVVVSAANHFLLVASWPYIPDSVPWPVATGSAWFLARGWIAPGLLDRVPGGAAASLILAALAVVLPLARSMACARPMSPRPAVATLIGILPVAVLLLRAPTPGFGGRLWRAAVYGAYSGRDPERRELREAAQSASTPTQRRLAEDTWRAYGPR